MPWYHWGSDVMEGIGVRVLVGTRVAVKAMVEMGEGITGVSVGVSPGAARQETRRNRSGISKKRRLLDRFIAKRILSMRPVQQEDFGEQAGIDVAVQPVDGLFGLGDQPARLREREPFGQGVDLGRLIHIR